MIIDYKDASILRGEHTILTDIDFQVQEGQFVYLTGVVGSGKTSLLKTIYGELDIASGKAEVLGRDMRRIKRRHLPALRKELGIVFQDFRLLTDRNVSATSTSCCAPPGGSRRGTANNASWRCCSW